MIARMVAGRALLGALTLAVVSVVTFVATQLLPGDAASAALGRSATPESLAIAREQLGLDRPALQQFLDWVTGVLGGDFGTSLAGGYGTTGQPVRELIGPLIGNSALLMLLSSLVIVPVAVVIGVVSARRPGGVVDSTLTTLTLGFGAIPTFVVGTVLVILFALGVQWFPAVSLVSSETPLGERLNALVLPVITLAAYAIAPTARTLRAGMIQVLDSDYVLNARLRGIHEQRLLWCYALPNAFVPTIQVIALTIAWLAGGIVVVEVVFSYPGIGQGLAKAVAARDIPTVQAVVLLIATLYVVINLLADIATILIDPKIRRRTGGASHA